MDPLTIKIVNAGMGVDHDMPCPVCKENVAVLNINSGVFQPCWPCQEKGWNTIQVPKRLRKLFRFLNDKGVLK